MPEDQKQNKELARLLRESKRLRKVSDDLARQAAQLRADIAKASKGRIVERRKKPRGKGK